MFSVQLLNTTMQKPRVRHTKSVEKLKKEKFERTVFEITQSVSKNWNFRIKQEEKWYRQLEKSMFLHEKVKEVRRIFDDSENR